MPATVDIVAKELHVLTEFKASEIKRLKTAMGLCEGNLSGKTEEEKKAWEYFVSEFYTYIERLHQDLSRHGD